MRICRNMLVLCTAILTFAQCTKKENEDYWEQEQLAFDSWMAKNNPQAEKLESGMYVEWIDKAQSGTVLAKGNWMEVNYLGRDIDGSVISTRDSMVAKREGTFTRYTHYGPHYANYDPDFGVFTEGEYEMLGKMRAGDSVRIYLPIRMAYRTASLTFAYGYEGWAYSSLNPKNGNGVSIVGKPVVIDLGLQRVVTDPSGRENRLAEEWASAQGYSIKDSVRQGLFYKLIEEDTTAEVIHEDSVVYISYVCRFLDGKLAQTNDAKVAYDEWGDYSTERSPSYFVASSSSIVGSSVNEIIKSEKVDVRYNSEMQIVFVSNWGYGVSGRSAASKLPVIYPYTPLVMDIKTQKKGYDPDATDEDEDE